MSFEILIITMWSIPILGFLLNKISDKYKVFEKINLNLLVIFSATTIIGIYFNISTINSIIDWILLTIPYLFFFFILWKLKSNKNKVIKILVITILLFSLTINYFLSTIGVLGIGFATNEYTPNYETTYDNEYTYKEITLGNALSDHRGKKIEIHKKYKWIPFIERKIQEKIFCNLSAYLSPIKKEYLKEKKMIRISAFHKFGDSIYTFKDSIIIEKLN